MIEAGLTVTGAVIGATGAALIEPLVIGVAVLIVAVALVMRFSDQRSAIEGAKEITPRRIASIE
jgi:hypothetical protein